MSRCIRYVQMEVTRQAYRAPRVPAASRRFFLRYAMGEQRDVVRAGPLDAAGNQCRLNQAPHLKHFACFKLRRPRHRGTAVVGERDDLLIRQPHQDRPNAGA